LKRPSGLNFNSCQGTILLPTQGGLGMLTGMPHLTDIEYNDENVVEKKMSMET
jgi:hypothetical protein